MRALIVRHYKTLLNASGQIMGWGDAPRDSGWQADLAFVGERFRQHGIRFDAIFSSELTRAQQTARYYARGHGIHILNDFAALNEINYGSLYKKSKKWVRTNIPQHQTDPDFVYPGGESFRQMQERSVRFLSSLTEQYAGQTILLVVHAGVIRGFVSHYLGLDYAPQLKRKISHRYIGDFVFEGGGCIRYDELGKKSDFVRDGVIEVPCTISASAAISRQGLGARWDGPLGMQTNP